MKNIISLLLFLFSLNSFAVLSTSYTSVESAEASCLSFAPASIVNAPYGDVTLGVTRFQDNNCFYSSSYAGSFSSYTTCESPFSFSGSYGACLTSLTTSADNGGNVDAVTFATVYSSIENARNSCINFRTSNGIFANASFFTNPNNGCQYVELSQNPCENPFTLQSSGYCSISITISTNGSGDSTDTSTIDIPPDYSNACDSLAGNGWINNNDGSCTCNSPNVNNNGTCSILDGGNSNINDADPLLTTLNTSYPNGNNYDYGICPIGQAYSSFSGCYSPADTHVNSYGCDSGFYQATYTYGVAQCFSIPSCNSNEKLIDIGGSAYFGTSAYTNYHICEAIDNYVNISTGNKDGVIDDTSNEDSSNPPNNNNDTVNYGSLVTALGLNTTSINTNNTNISANTNALNANNTNLVANSQSLNTNNTNLVSNTESLNNNTNSLNALTDVINNDDSDGAINSKLTDSFSSLKNNLTGNSYTFNNSGSACPTWTFDENAMLVGGLIIDSHCYLSEEIRPIISPLMLVFFSIVGFRTVFSA